MGIRRASFLWIVGHVFALQSFSGEPANLELMRAFPLQKCSYTLPSPEWAWAEKPAMAECVFLARSNAQHTVLLTVQPTWVDYFHPDFVKGIDEKAAASGVATKVSSREITFKGLVCYESKMHLATVSKTMVSRYVLTHGSTYCLSVVYPDTAEVTPSNLDSMMDGFAFTTPPVPNKGPDRKPDYRKLGELIGGAVMTFAMIAVALKILYNAFLRKS